jgi:NAD(P)H-quinone oxidoreductase subunit 2
VKKYPRIRWNLPGMRPIQVGLVFLLIATSLMGILSNPVVTIANKSVTSSLVLKASLEAGINNISATEVKTLL